MIGGRSIRSGVKWLVAGNLGGNFLQFVFGVVLARLLVPADFGMLVTIQIFTGIAGYVAGGGMGEALVQAREVNSQHYRVVFTIQLAIGVLIYAFFYYFAPWFSRWYDNSIYIELMRVAAISFILRPFANIPSSMLRREMRFNSVAKITIVTMLIAGIASILMALGGMGVWSLVLGGLVGSVVSIMMLSWAAGWLPGLAFDWPIANRLGKYGFKVTANEIIIFIREQTSNFLISRILGAAMVGLYNKADSLGKLPFQIVNRSVYQPVFRTLARKQDDIDQSRYIYFRTISLLSVYTFPFYVGLWWLAEPFIRVVYGEKWVPAAEPLSILAIAGLFTCVTHPSGALLAAQNLLGRELVIQFIVWGVIIAGCMIGIHWGIAGVAWGIVVSRLILSVLMSWSANIVLGSGYDDLVNTLMPGMLLNVILFAVLAGFHEIFIWTELIEGQAEYLFLMTGIGALTYALAFLLLPISSLKSESDRWKKLVRIGRQ